MALSVRQVVEPFVERVGLLKTRASDDLYRLGYRVVGIDTVVAAIEIPANLLEDAISSSLTLSCRLTPDGCVIPESSFELGQASTGGTRGDLLQLDQLIQATLTPENLRLEEATTANLTTLLQRLEMSANVVRDVLARGMEL